VAKRKGVGLFHVIAVVPCMFSLLGYGQSQCTVAEMSGWFMCGEKLFLVLSDQEAVGTESSSDTVSLCKTKSSAEM
jgi:hypothetical protein